MRNKISLFSLTILIVSAIDSVRTLPSTAYFGFSLIFYHLLAAVVFLIPVALISAEFSSRFPNEGGIFYWVKHAFGSKFGVCAVWLQWINTMVWYPTLLLFIAGTTSYLISPDLAKNKVFLLGVSLLAFWLLTLLNLRGVETSVKINSICAILGTFLPIAVLIGFGFWWLGSHQVLATPFSWRACIPTWNLFENSNAVVTITASFLGMELAGVYVNDIKDPQKNFPRAIAYSIVILLITLIFGALSIAYAVPKNEIQFVDGMMQTLAIFFTATHIPYLLPLLAILIIIGSTAGAVNWMISPAKGLMQAAEDGFLPPYFTQQNKWGVPHRILILQALVVTCFSCIIQVVPSINTYYWFLVSLSTGLYVLMYVLLFMAALKLRRPKKGFKILKGIRTISCVTGLLFSILTIVLGFQPAPGVPVENTTHYIVLILAGFVLMLLPVLLLWNYRNKQIAALAVQVSQSAVAEITVKSRSRSR